MQCPFCGQDSDKVVDSRSSEGGRVVRRRRQCLKCSRRFTTYERIEDSVKMTVVKKDGARVPFDRNKILAGLQAASYKRPISESDLRGIVDAAEEEIFRQCGKEVPTSLIGDVVSRLLRKVDQVAYVRFASVYRAFEDVGEFIEEANAVISRTEDAPEQRKLFDEPSDK